MFKKSSEGPAFIRLHVRGSHAVIRLHVVGTFGAVRLPLPAEGCGGAAAFEVLLCSAGPAPRILARRPLEARARAARGSLAGRSRIVRYETCIVEV